jgi:rhodanese-related sulfurtransferase
MRYATKTLILLVFATLGAASACSNKGAQSRGEEARRWVAQGAVLLDVRTPQEYASGHLPGAINIPVQVLASRMGEIPKGSKVVVYCHSGVRARQAASMLSSKGYEVFDLGSFRDWGS